MSVITEHPANTGRRIGVVSFIVFLSLVLPVAIVVWSGLSFLSGKPLGRPSSEMKIYQGSLKNGELWFTAARIKGNPLMPTADWRIKTLNLETGVESETGLVIPAESFGWPVWNADDELYVYLNSAVYKKVDATLELVCSNPGSARVAPFFYQDQLSTIVETEAGGYRLLHLVDGKWVEGRPILLPKPGRVWYDDKQRERTVLLPLTSLHPIPSTTLLPSFPLQVMYDDRQTPLYLTDHHGFAAYRSGFEFEELHDDASALAPENAPHDVTGWEPIQPTATGDRWMTMGADELGLLFCSWGNPQRIVRRTTDGRWENLVESDRPLRMNARLIPYNRLDAINYVIDEDQLWGAVTVCRIEGNTIQPAHLTLPGCTTEYLTRWRRLLMGILIAWLVHLVVLIAGMQLLNRGTSNSIYEFGVQRVMLASTSRRGLALIVDGLLLMMLFIASVFVQSLIVEPNWGWERSTDRKLSKSFYEVERAFLPGRGTGLEFVPARLCESLVLMMFGHPPKGQLHFPALFLSLFFVIDTAIVLCVLRVYFAGRYGITPGKWLVGIRTVRSTLRPCGIARALVRDVLYWFDIPFLLTPLPAAISMMLSPLQQRLGDRVADTLVINAGSLRNVANRP